MNELDRYKDIPRDVFEERIVKGEIKSIIQLRKEINEFKIRFGGKRIDIYSRIREDLKHLKNFENFSENWKN